LLLSALAALLLQGCSLLPGTREPPAEPPTPAAAASGPLAFTLDVHAPDTVRETLVDNLELQRYRQLPDLQAGELSRLLVAADANARELLGTLGYFSPAITIESRPAPQGSAAPRHVVLTVEPGQQTTVTGTQIDFTGAAAQSPGRSPESTQRFEADARRVQRNWPLAPGDAFTQRDWDNAKTQGLRRLQERRYPTARLAGSHAEIDADQHRADLNVTYDTGPAYRFGPLQVNGSERYDPDGARRIARLPSGADYSEAELLDAQQRLASSGYYDAVFLTLDTEHADPQAATVTAPVVAQVREAKLQKVVFGAGFSTDSGPRLSVDHIHNRLPWLGWRATTKLSLDRDARLLDTEWVSLPNDGNWRRFGAGQVKREATGSYDVNSVRLRGGVSQTSAHIDRNYYLQYDAAHAQGVDAPADSGAISANYGWTGRYFNDNANPTRGTGVGLELGVGTTLRGQRDPFVRARVRWQSFVPLGKVAVSSGSEPPVQRNARLALRAEGGAVVAREGAQVPVTQLFITGGDTTVRGYGYRSIGAHTDNGTLYGGRYLAVASAEWQRPIAVRGDVTHWESALFVDAGAVTDALQRISPRVGVGAGLRWRSPVGPLQADVAWGVQSRSVRLHLRLGFTF
jgi:translocation and assembly module TamA